jgi:energy-coupling factor transport system ATP-binding protein
MLAIVGTNGAGKSTFSKVVCGFEEPTKGSITLCGEDFSTYSIKERAEHVGYVMQNPNAMISQVMIYDEVAFGLKNRGIPQDEIDRRVEEALRVCGLWRMRKWPISALSFGQQKRVTIASILVLGPEMIILDEPTAGQDYKHYTDIMEFLLELHAKGITIVMITHDMHLMLEYATRAVVFSHGRVIADDTPAHILTNPQIIEEASLKETSLYHLAMKCNLKDPTAFVQRFIDYERNTARHDESV